jgi:RND family efflux transporter MFP subunit
MVTIRARARRAAVVAVVLAAACGGNRYEPPPPPEVTVSRPIERELTTYSEFTGHTVAVEAVDIRARVQGYLQSVNFTPGSEVKKGELLFVIEPDLYQARYDQAKADLEGKEAQARAAEAQLEITQAIFARSAGSRTDLVQKVQQRDLARAQVAIARATLEAAQLDLAYTHIYAPIDGRIDRNLVDVGNLVGSGQPTLLASIVRHDPIYTYFTASERELLQYRELQRQKRTVAPEGQHNVAYLALVTDVGFPHVGQIDYSGNRVDPDTGTIEIRAVFPNPDRSILPGLFVRVRVPSTRERTLLVPEAALSTDQGGKYVLTVDDKSTVQYRRVRTGSTANGGLRAIVEGIGRDDWVVVNGLQRARPGAVVKPARSEIQAPDPAPPTAGPSPGPAS